MARRVLDIFLSSTSEDLGEYRRAVIDALSRLGLVAAVRMETFGARPNAPLDVCREEVTRCDALIVLVGPRYGWVPSREEGGDGRRSITWYEVEWALDHECPVYAFMLDPSAPWSGPREQDRLISATTEAQSAEVWRAVRGLQEFREFLDRRTTREQFDTPDRLATRVTTSLFPWLLENASPLRPSRPQDQQPVLTVSADGEPQVGHDRYKLLPGQMYWQEQIHAPSARTLLGPRPPVRVAVVGGRPHAQHPALADVPITYVGADDASADRPGDDYTSALIALISGKGGDGYLGIAPGAPVLAISVLTEAMWSTNEEIGAGIDRAVLGGARVICLSLGSTQRSETIDNAIADAVEAGVVVVAAAGNEGDDTKHYPAASPGVLAVGAIDHRRRLPTWTSRGPWVHLMAPGDDLLLPSGEDGYQTFKGTSWPCAIVSGAVALLLQADPQMTPSSVREILVDTAQVIDSDLGTEGGRVLDVYAAVRRVLTDR